MRRKREFLGRNVTPCYRQDYNQDYITRFYWFISSDLDAKDTGLVFAVINFVSCYVPDFRQLL